jgi:hypothetical protein
MQAKLAAEASEAAAGGAARDLASIHDGQLAALRVADAAHREWAEAHAGLEATAMAADRELRTRGLAERIPVTDAEVAEASARPREVPAIDLAEAARWKAEQTAQVEADRQARAEASARLTPVTDAEIERYGGDVAEIKAELDRIGDLIDQIPDRETERRAQIEQEIANEPGVRPVQAEPSLELSWQPGEAGGHYEQSANAEAEADMEMEL